MESAVTRRLAHRPWRRPWPGAHVAPSWRSGWPRPWSYEAGRAHISPSVLAAVLLIENAPFDTSAVSSEGAIGLMQVMPMHVGNYRCLSGDLLNVEANICHGARLLQMHCGGPSRSRPPFGDITDASAAATPPAASAILGG